VVRCRIDHSCVGFDRLNELHWQTIIRVLMLRAWQFPLENPSCWNVALIPPHCAGIFVSNENITHFDSANLHSGSNDDVDRHSTFSLFLPPIERELGLSRALATLPYVVAMLGWAVGAITFGKLADDRGARPVVLVGILLMAAGFAGMGLSRSLWQLSLTYGVLVGLAMGACSLAIMSLLVSKHYLTNRGLAVAVIQTAPPMSPLLFAPVIYFLIRSYDWRSAALASSALLFFVALPLAWLGARDPAGSEAARNTRMAYMRDSIGV
jgi:hypothetical protein